MFAQTSAFCSSAVTIIPVSLKFGQRANFGNPNFIHTHHTDNNQSGPENELTTLKLPWNIGQNWINNPTFMVINKKRNKRCMWRFNLPSILYKLESIKKFESRPLCNTFVRIENQRNQYLYQLYTSI